MKSFDSSVVEVMKKLFGPFSHWIQVWKRSHAINPGEFAVPAATAGVNRMFPARPKNPFSPISCGTIKRFRLAVLNALTIVFTILLLSGASELAVAQDIFGRIVG